MNESDIQDFWNRYPCGDLQVGGLQQRRGNYEAWSKNRTRRVEDLLSGTFVAGTGRLPYLMEGESARAVEEG